MCWNWKVSIGSFVLITIISYILYSRNLNNDRLLAIFLFSYGSMQFFETLIWLGQNKKYEDLNKIGSIGASALLYTHPLAFIVGMYYDKQYTNIILSQEFMLCLVGSILWFAFGIYQISVAYKTKTYSLTSYPDSKSNHLVWDFPDHYKISLVFLGLIIAYFMFPNQKIFVLCLALYFMIPVITLLLTMKVDDNNKTKNYAGSYWCWYVAVFSFMFYVVNPMISNK
jgi:uncharacterized membrane protein SpoIIM required for sporulation